MIRVLHVISDENIGGAGVLLSSLLKNLDENRIESLVALPKKGALCERLSELHVPIFSLDVPVDRLSARSVIEVRRLLRVTKPDLVHSNAAISARFCARLCHIPVMHTRHCCFPPEGIWRYGPIRKLGGVWNRALSDLVIATAEAAKTDLLMLGIPQNRIHVVINGSEPIRELTDSELQEIRKKWGLTERDFTVGICARLVPCKGHRVFLEAAKKLIEAAPLYAFRFLVVGEGEERANLEAFCRELGISKHVIFTGFVSDMATVYRILRVNVNCSTGTETSCLAISEGMSAGVPAVVSDYGGNRAMIGESMAGIVYPAGDSQCLFQAVLSIANDPAREQRMRSAAYRRYLEHYTARGMAEEVEKLYLDLAGQRANKS
ncbi:MAG: glycosyltransferase [Ruminococcaceae bacterium]|nr:glycosyltransferase [Oscillospiraceae bacterium]